MAYSFNRSRTGLVFARTSDVNASFKDLGAVCDAIRYKSAPGAIAILDTVMNKGTPILYRKYNKYMGSRHELGGRKGRSPMKCARIVKKVLANAIANAENKGEDPQTMYVVHASANKTTIIQRTAPKGVLRLGHSMGRGSIRRTDIELARLEIGLGYGEEEGLSGRMKRLVKREQRIAAIQAPTAPAKAEQKRPRPAQKAAAQPKEPPKKQAAAAGGTKVEEKR